jgi:hypothetical protein
VYDPDLSLSYLKRSKVKKAPKDLPTPRRLEEMHQRGKNQKRAELHHFRDTQRKRVQLSVLRPITSTPRRLEEMYQKGKNQKRAELHHIRDTKRKRVQLSVLRPINNKILDEKSNRLNELYEKGKKQNRTDLERFLWKKYAIKYVYVDKKHMKLEKPKAITSERITYNKRMFDLRKKNHAIAVKRRMQIARARSRVSQSLPFQASNGDSSSLSSSTSSPDSSKAMFELRGKNSDFAIKRKMQIARARARRTLK